MLNRWSQAISESDDWLFITECQRLLVHAEKDLRWYLLALDDCLQSLNESTPKWDPEDRLLSAIFDKTGGWREKAYQEVRVARVSLEIAGNRGDAMIVLARLMLLARALVEYRRTVRQWGRDPWVEMVALHASETAGSGSDVLRGALWIDDIARERMEMERAIRRLTRTASGSGRRPTRSPTPRSGRQE